MRKVELTRTSQLASGCGPHGGIVAVHRVGRHLLIVGHHQHAAASSRGRGMRLGGSESPCRSVRYDSENLAFGAVDDASGRLIGKSSGGEGEGGDDGCECRFHGSAGLFRFTPWGVQSVQLHAEANPSAFRKTVRAIACVTPHQDGHSVWSISECPFTYSKSATKPE